LHEIFSPKNPKKQTADNDNIQSFIKQSAGFKQIRQVCRKMRTLVDFPFTVFS